MISASKFAANLRGFTKLDAVARTMFAETVGYVTFQYHKHGNRDPFNKLAAADLPGWVKDGFRKLKLGKRDPNMTEEAADKRGDAYAAQVFAAQAEKRAIAKAQREAKQAAKEGAAPSKVEDTTPPAAEPPKEDEERGDSLVFNGVALSITPAESSALYDLLMKLRQPALSVVNG